MSLDCNINQEGKLTNQIQDELNYCLSNLVYFSNLSKSFLSVKLDYATVFICLV